MPTGIRDIGTSLQAYVRVNGRFYSECFPYGTPLKTLKEWREDKRVAVRTGADIPTVSPTVSTFAEDAAAYLKLKTSMPSYSDRARHIQEWVRYFGRRPRDTITAQMIRARLEQLIADDYAPNSVNHRRTALMDLWTTLDGQSAANPVRDVPKYAEGTGEIRALGYGIIYRILCTMRPSRARCYLRVMAWTGWPPQQIRQLRPEHLNLKKGYAYVTPRRKGKGTQGDWLPLLPGAIVALTEFHKRGEYSSDDDEDNGLDHAALYHSFQRALNRYNAHRAIFHRRPIEASPYSLRHSFGMLVAAIYKDDSIVQRLMLHSSPAQTQRYIRAARGYRLDAAATSATSEGISGALKGLQEIGETGVNRQK